jgi:hypothetical protein
MKHNSVDTGAGNQITSHTSTNREPIDVFNTVDSIPEPRVQPHSSQVHDGKQSELKTDAPDLQIIPEPKGPIKQEVLSHNEASSAQIVRKPVNHPEEFKNKVVVLKAVPKGTFRLGLASQKEKFMSFPGTTFRYAPKLVGNSYRTGLNHPIMGATIEEKRERLAWLEYQLGRKLDATYYADMSILLDRNSQTGEKLHLEKARDFVIFLTMLESEQIANGLHESKNGTKPYAEFYIENREAEAEHKASQREVQIQVLQKFNELSDVKKRYLATMAGQSVNGLSPLATGNALWDWMESEEEPKMKPIRQQQFLTWIGLGDTYITVSALVKNAILFNIIRKNGAGDYFYGDTLLGQTEEEAIKRLSTNTASDIRLGIQSKVNQKIS